MYAYERHRLEREEMEKIEKLQEHDYDHYYSIYEKEHQSKYISLMSSMSHTYGNVFAFMQNYIINLFPENMFKTVHVSSKIAHRQIKSTPYEFLKKMKPMIIFRPRIPNIDEDRFLKGTALTERQVDIYHQWGTGNLQTFFDDENKDLSIRFQLNRSIMYMDVIVVLSTLSQQLDYYHYLANAIRINHPYFIDTCLESYLPQEMLAIISQCSEIPLYNEEGSTKDFLDYMNQNSCYPITYKLQGSTKSREFYRYYPANIETTITDLDKDDGERSNQIMDQYKITFTVKMEFNSTGFYFIYNDNIFNLKLPQVDPIQSEFIPIYTDVFDVQELNLKPGWHIFNRGSFRLENENDIVDMKELFNRSIKEALDYHLKQGLPIFDFFDVKIRMQGKIIHEFENYTIDWEKYYIHFINGDLYHTYTIIFCVNVEYVNNLVKTVYNLE